MLCGIGIGIGVGYGIWYGDVPGKATAEPQKPGDKTTTVPKPPSTAKPEATTAKAGDGTTSHGGTSAPGNNMIDKSTHDWQRRGAVGLVFPCLPPLGPPLPPIQILCGGGHMWSGFSPGRILWGFPPTSKTETSFCVFSPWGFLASIVIKFTFLIILGFTTRLINEMKMLLPIIEPVLLMPMARDA